MRQVLPPKLSRIEARGYLSASGGLDPMRLVLKIRAGSDSGREIVIEQGVPARIGRKSPAEFVFPRDPLMSRLHFSVECGADAGRIQDLNSSNGTWVNGRRVSGAVLKEGDEIAAGEIRFTVHIERDQPRAVPPAAAQAAPLTFLSPAELRTPLPHAPIVSALPEPELPAVVPPPSVPAAPEPSLQDRLLRLLRADFQPLYAILDGARSLDIYKLLAEAKEEARRAWEAHNPGASSPTFQPPAAGMLEGGAQYESLYEGRSKAELTLFAPYLVSLPPWSKLLEKLVSKGWGKSWGIYLTCNLPFHEVRHHFRHFLMVNMPDGDQVYFRFYDPRVLRVYLPTCTPKETDEFFGPVSRFAAEDEKPESLLEFVRQETGMKSYIWHLAPSETPAAGAAAASSLEKTQPPAALR